MGSDHPLFPIHGAKDDTDAIQSPSKCLGHRAVNIFLDCRFHVEKGFGRDRHQSPQLHTKEPWRHSSQRRTPQRPFRLFLVNFLGVDWPWPPPAFSPSCLITLRATATASNVGVLSGPHFHQEGTFEVNSAGIISAEAMAVYSRPTLLCCLNGAPRILLCKG